MSASNPIRIVGAKTHNLKNVSVSIPRGKLTVITGPSGSGKSSLAIDTLFAEGQRRYMETISGYARQFLDLLDKPDVDQIHGLSPAICVDQKRSRSGPRSTAGTLTDIHRLFRLLYSQCGHIRSPKTGKRLHAYTVREVVDELQSLPDKHGAAKLKVILSAPQPRINPKTFTQRIDEFRSNGFSRIYAGGRFLRLDDEISPSDAICNDISIVIDRLLLKPASQIQEKTLKRLTDSVELCLKISDGTLLAHIGDKGEIQPYHTYYYDDQTGEKFGPLSPELFSFNTKQGACRQCDGSGMQKDSTSDCPLCHGHRLNLAALSATIQGLSIADVCMIETGELEKWVGLILKGECPNRRSQIRPRCFNLQPISPQSDAFTPTETKLARSLLKEIHSRLNILIRLGLSHLPLGRSAQTLSGGEVQRLRIGMQLFATLSGVLYILDEPSIGLHPSDMRPMVSILHKLCENGNTCVIVEHDKQAIRASHHIVEMGPGAGVKGGELIFEGPYKKLLSLQTQTARYLNKAQFFSKSRLNHNIQRLNIRQSCLPDDDYLHISGASKHNLKNLTVKIPLAKFTALTGVSGSGKSTLLFHVLLPAVKAKLDEVNTPITFIKKLTGYRSIQKLVVVDSTPIAKHSRSNPATYTGIFNAIRTLFASTTDAKVRGYKASRFSFNKPGGRCEHCKGEGVISIHTPLFNDIEVVCEHCKGKRFNRETLMVRFKGKSIADVLGLSIDEAHVYFRSIPSIRRKLELLCEVGLGYLPLGQPLSLLSGGENQRLKLASELAVQSDRHTLYLLDEPSTGLHFEDVKKLLLLLHSLVAKGHSVIAVEHNLDIIACADWIIELGPGPGRHGGNIICQGGPKTVCDNELSPTGGWLKGSNTLD